MNWPLEKKITISPLKFETLSEDAIQAFNLIEPVLRQIVELFLNLHVKRAMAFEYQLNSLNKLKQSPFKKSWDELNEFIEKYGDRFRELHEEWENVFELLQKCMDIVIEANHCDECSEFDELPIFKFVQYFCAGWNLFWNRFPEVVDATESVAKEVDQILQELSKYDTAGQFWRLYHPSAKTREKNAERLRQGFLSKPINYKKWRHLKDPFLREADNRANLFNKDSKDVIENIKLSNIWLSTGELKDVPIGRVINDPFIVKQSVDRLMTEDFLWDKSLYWQKHRVPIESDGCNESSMHPSGELSTDVTKVLFQEWCTKEIGELEKSEILERKCREHRLDLNKLTKKELQAIRYKAEGIIPPGVKPANLRKRLERLKAKKGIS